MNDSNLGIEQLSGPWTNQNSIHPPPQCIVAMCFQIEGNWLVAPLCVQNFCVVHVVMGVQQNSRKCNSNKCILANSFFKPTDKIVSSVTQRTYSCMNYEKSCNSSNIIYLITCSNCLMQYVGETAQQLISGLPHTVLV